MAESFNSFFPFPNNYAENNIKKQSISILHIAEFVPINSHLHPVSYDTPSELPKSTRIGVSPTKEQEPAYKIHLWYSTDEVLLKL